MLLLLFRAGDQWYAFDARQVVEVLPCVELRLIPHAPSPLRGLLRHRGELIPVADANAALGCPIGPARLSTRIVLTEFVGESGESVRLGVLAERVGEVVRGDESREVLPTMKMAEAPYLGSVRQSGDRLIQLIRPEKLLTDTLRLSLLGQRAESSP